METEFGYRMKNLEKNAGKLRSSISYDYIRNALLEGTLKPGEKIDVNQVAKVLGVSRYPVLDALKRLASEHLVQIVPQVGSVVIKPNQDEVVHHFEFMSRASEYFSMLAAKNIDNRQIPQLRDLCAKMRRIAQARHPKSEDLKSFRRYNREFHSIIYEASGVPVLTSIISSLWDLNDFYISSSGSRDVTGERMLEACDEHDQLVEALTNRDAKSAGKLHRSHLLNIVKRITSDVPSAE